MHQTLSAQLQHLIDDVICVRSDPPELEVDELQLNEINLPTPESKGIQHLMLISSTLKQCEQNPLSETADEIEDMDNSK